MPGILTTVVGADIKPFANDMNSVQMIAARAGRSIRTDLSAGAASGFNLNLVMRETLVIFREIGRGNWARVPGSFSILLSGLGLLKYLFTAAGAAITAAGVSAYYFWQHLKKVNAELDNTGKLIGSGFGNMMKAVREASIEAANAYADQVAWMKKLGEQHETLADHANERIRLLREESQLRREASGDKSKAAELKEEAQLRQNELTVLDDAIEKQRKLVTASIKAEESSSNAAETGQSAIARNARLKNSSGVLGDVDANVKKFTELQRILQDQFDNDIDTKAQRTLMRDPNPLIRRRGEKNLDALTSKDREVEYEGQKYRISLKTATEQLNANLRAQSLQREQDRLAEAQRELARALADSKEKTIKDKNALEELTKERNRLAADIFLHRLWDNRIAAASMRPEMHGSVNSLQRIGAYTAAASDPELAIQQRQEQHLKQVVKILESNNQIIGRLIQKTVGFNPFGGSQH